MIILLFLTAALVLVAFFMGLWTGHGARDEKAAQILRDERNARVAAEAALQKSQSLNLKYSDELTEASLRILHLQDSNQQLVMRCISLGKAFKPKEQVTA